jgi:hypothetical protein
MANWKNKQWEGESTRKKLASETKRLKNKRNRPKKCRALKKERLSCAIENSVHKTYEGYVQRSTSWLEGKIAPIFAWPHLLKWLCLSTFCLVESFEATNSNGGPTKCNSALQ